MQRLIGVLGDSIAGFVALSGQLVNIRDVYDDDELRRISPHLELRREVDANTGFHSRQMLVAPIRDPDTGSLLGVVQLINTLNREPMDSNDLKMVPTPTGSK